MDTRPWLERVRHECVRRRLPPFYVERLLAELTDHLQDYQEDHMSMEVQDLRSLECHLGAPHTVAASAAAEYHRARFCGRHPVLSFIVLPLLVVPVLCATSAFAIVLVADLLGFSGDAAQQRVLSEFEFVAMSLVSRAVVLLPVALAAIGFSWLAARSAVGWRWIAAVSLLVAFLGGISMVNLALPGNGQQGSLSFGLGVSAHPSLEQILQFALPLTIGAWTIVRQWPTRSRLLPG